MLNNRETDVHYFARRAIEAAQAAARAACRRASAAHRHMAVAYATRVRNEQSAVYEFEDLLIDLDEAEVAREEGGPAQPAEPPS